MSEMEARQELLGGGEESEEDQKRVRKTATVDQLKKKRRVTKTVYIGVTDEDGEPVEVALTFRALAGSRYDELVAKHPPRPEDKKQGYFYNPDAFGPALIAATCIEPELSEEDVLEIWESDDWNRGERMILLMAAIEVCTSGLNIPFKRNAPAMT